MENEKAGIERFIYAKEELKKLIQYSDELPEEFIVGNPNYKNHKFKGNWFQGVLTKVRFIARYSNDNELLRDAEIFNENKSARHGERTTREEIEQADALIKRALEKNL